MSTETREFYSRLKARTVKVLQGIQGKVSNYEKEVALIDELILDTFKPQRFDGNEGREVQLIKQFDKSCLLLTKHLYIQEPGRLPVRKYYMALASLKDQFKEKPNKKSNGAAYSNIRNR